MKWISIGLIALMASCTANPTENGSISLDDDSVESNIEIDSLNAENCIVIDTIIEIDEVEDIEEITIEDVREDKTISEVGRIDDSFYSSGGFADQNETPWTPLDHKMWDDLLRKYVSSSGKVNYAGFKADKKFNKYLLHLAGNHPNSEWNTNETMAYWINVYNAFTIKTIVDNYPVKSIMDIDKAWEKKNIKLGVKTYSLSQIENDILRKMGDARIHFAINCASESCPKLLNKAFNNDNLQRYLKQTTSDFLNDESKNNFKSNPIQLSKIFEWYKEDFSKGDIISYINKHSSLNLPANSKIEYLEYDWSLND